MVKRLPCPVCAGESFIESATQGGLICVDCGTVSNQVEVQDDDDTAEFNQTRSNIRTYQYVSEQESKAKRERRTRLSVLDRRGPEVILEGLTLILKHMCDKLLESGHCTDVSVTCIRSLWFELLTTASHAGAIGKLLDHRYIPNRYFADMIEWGVPSRDQQREMVCKDMPPNRRKQIHALQRMMEDRQLTNVFMDVVQDGPPLIYMHDWLVSFFGLSSFVFPDELLTLSGESLTLDQVLSSSETVSTIVKAEEISPRKRRDLIRVLFYSIMCNEDLRKDFLRHHHLDEAPPQSHSSSKPVESALTFPCPDLNLVTMLGVIVLGIRNSGGGVLPMHVLDWVTRGELPFFSAHTCLPPELDRMEFYWAGTRQMSYNASLFSPEALPLESELIETVNQIMNYLRDVSGPFKPNDVTGLAENSLDFLGLSPLIPIATRIIQSAIFDMIIDKKQPLVQPMGRYSLEACKMLKNGEDWKHDDIFFGDLSRSEFVTLVLIVTVKLVCPDLHEPCSGGELSVPLVDELLESDPGFRYVIRWFSTRAKPTEFLSLRAWDGLTKAEKETLLRYYEMERFNELRPCLIDDLRETLNGEFGDPCLLGVSRTNTGYSGQKLEEVQGSNMPHSAVTKSEDVDRSLPGVSRTNTPSPSEKYLSHGDTRHSISVGFGRIRTYTIAPTVIDDESLLTGLLSDVMAATGVHHLRFHRLHKLLGEFERNLIGDGPDLIVGRSPLPRAKR